MGKKSRRVRGATPASKPNLTKVNTIVAWMDGNAVKQNLGMDMERGKTIKDVKVKVESMTGVPVARCALFQEDKLLGGEIEVPDHVPVDVDGPMEPFIMREREKKRAGPQLPCTTCHPQSRSPPTSSS